MFLQQFGILAIVAASAASFQIGLPQQKARPSPTTELASSTPSFGKTTVISPDDNDFQFDTGLGGVRLAQESAVKLTGSVKASKGASAASFKDLVRYTALQEVSDSQLQDQLPLGARVIASGSGVESYQDPGSGSEKVVLLAPLRAVEDALQAAKSASDAGEVVINVLGGDDLQFLEVKDALEQLVPQLDIGKAAVRFHSLCHHSCAATSVTVTIVALAADTSSNGLSGVSKAIASGEVYFCDGKWWTVVEEDINTANA
jgi:hypothetical protein